MYIEDVPEIKLNYSRKKELLQINKLKFFKVQPAKIFQSSSLLCRHSGASVFPKCLTTLEDVDWNLFQATCYSYIDVPSMFRKGNLVFHLDLRDQEVRCTKSGQNSGWGSVFTPHFVKYTVTVKAVCDEVLS